MSTGAESDYDAWMAGYAADIPPERRGPLFDHSGDGLVNLLKFAFGLDPTVPGGTERPMVAITEEGGNRYVELTFRRRVGGVGDAATGYTVDGITYTAQANPGLAPDDWQSGGSLFVTVGTPSNNGDGTETVTVRYTQPLESGGPHIKAPCNAFPVRAQRMRDSVGTDPRIEFEEAASGVTIRSTDRIEPEKAQRPEAANDPRLGWWRKAGFGAFIHWGLYALPDDRWTLKYPPRHPGRWTQEWVMQVRRIPLAEYARLAGEFAPRRFDPEAWLDTFEAAGMKYLVVTAKHHDGFCLFRTRHTPFNVVDATPFRRDVIAALAEACARRRMPFGIYYSQTQDWSHPDGHGNDWDYDAAGKDFQRYLDGLVHSQIEELLTGYGPIAILWFDTPMIMTETQSRALLDQVHRLQPGCLVNGRIGHGLGDYATTRDNQYLTADVQQDWECPATINDTWGYRASDTNWKRPEELLENLQRVRRLRGNFLLSVGPDPDGEIPGECVRILRQLGELIKQTPEKTAIG